MIRFSRWCIYIIGLLVVVGIIVVVYYGDMIYWYVNVYMNYVY